MPKKNQKECLDNIESNMNVLKTYLEENIALKENAPDVPATGSERAKQILVLPAAFLAQVSPDAAEQLVVSFEKASNSLEIADCRQGYGWLIR